MRAEIGTLAAVLRTLTVGGVHVTEPFEADSLPPFGDGIVLVPWPNRVADGIWTHEGEEQKLDITEVARGNALHGLLRNTAYEVREKTESAVTLGAIVHPQHGWPFHLDTWVRYELTSDGITVTHGATNIGTERSPYAVGTHPFLRVGDAPVEDLVLRVAADTYFVVDDRLNPTADSETPVEGTHYDLRDGHAVGALELDTAFGEVGHAHVQGGAGEVAWLTAPDGARTTLWQDVDWGYLQVFTTRIFPKAEGLALAVAVEPMTAPPNALNSGQGLVWIEPGASWSGSWGLRFTPAGAAASTASADASGDQG